MWRRHVLGRRQELELTIVVRLRRGGRGRGRRGWGRPWWRRGRSELRGARRLRRHSGRDLGDGRRRMYAARCARVERAVVLPRHEGAFLPIGPQRLGGEQLVERLRRARPGVIGAGAEERRGGLRGIRPQQQRHLPRLREIMLVRFHVVSRQRERQRRVRVIPPDEARPLLLELLLDVVPQPRHHVARAVAIDRLVQAQRDVDHEVEGTGLGTLALVAEQKPEDALTGAVRRRHVLENRGERGLRQEDGKGDVAGSLGAPARGAPQDRLADRDRLAQRTGGGHAQKIKRWWRFWRLWRSGRLPR